MAIDTVIATRLLDWLTARRTTQLRHWREYLLLLHFRIESALLLLRYRSAVDNSWLEQRSLRCIQPGQALAAPVDFPWEVVLGYRTTVPCIEEHRPHPSPIQ